MNIDVKILNIRKSNPVDVKKQDKKFNQEDFMPGMKSWFSIQKKIINFISTK